MTAEEPECIAAVPPTRQGAVLRLLVLRQFDDTPPAFAMIEQTLLRQPLRVGRHGVSFAATFLPEVMAWLDARLGRATLHDADGKPYRNPAWPTLAWQRESRVWPDGRATVEWFVEITFSSPALCEAFAQAWMGLSRV